MPLHLLPSSKILPGIEVDGFRAALIASLVIELASATVDLLLKITLLPFVNKWHDAEARFRICSWLSRYTLRAGDFWGRSCQQP